MKLFWTLQLGIGAASVAFLTAHGCGGNVVVDSTGTATETSETDTNTDILTVVGPDTDPGTETNFETDSDFAGSCSCACLVLSSAGGCSDLCSNLHTSVPTVNFCEGTAPLAQCATCLAANCPDLSTAADTCSGM